MLNAINPKAISFVNLQRMSLQLSWKR